MYIIVSVHSVPICVCVYVYYILLLIEEVAMS